MALLAESLVEEWLNREWLLYHSRHQARSRRNGLARRASSVRWGGRLACRGYGELSAHRITSRVSQSEIPRRRGSYVRKRTPEQVQVYARNWVEAKFRAPDKGSVYARDSVARCHVVFSSHSWSHPLSPRVGGVRARRVSFATRSTSCFPTYRKRDGRSFSGSAGGDLAEIISYYKSHETKNA